MTRAIVVGGGIVGASVAYHLARDGVDTVAFDREDEGRATPAGSGILSPPTSNLSESDTWYELAAHAVGYYPSFVDSVEAAVGGETGYARTGMVGVAVTDDADEAFAATLERTRRRSERLGFPDPGEVYEIPPGEAPERFPPLATPRRAFYYEGAARVDGGRLLDAVRRAAESAGAEVRRADVEEVRVEDGEATGVTADGRRHDADAVVVAGGAWSAEFGDQLGVEVPVGPMRGQVVDLDLGAEGADSWPIVAGLDHPNLTPWWNGRTVVSSTKEPDAGFAPHATAAGIHGLLEDALELAPGLRDAPIEGFRAGLRPVSADDLPVIGAVPGVDGAYLATGHGPTGLQLGPYTGKLIADLFAGRTPEADLSPFDPARFA